MHNDHTTTVMVKWPQYFTGNWSKWLQVDLRGDWNNTGIKIMQDFKSVIEYLLGEPVDR